MAGTEILFFVGANGSVVIYFADEVDLRGLSSLRVASMEVVSLVLVHSNPHLSQRAGMGRLSSHLTRRRRQVEQPLDLPPTFTIIKISWACRVRFYGEYLLWPLH